MLAIVGGSGRLPDILCEAQPAALRWVPAGTIFGTGQHTAHAFRYEQLGGLVDELRSAGVDRISFAGALRRPQLDLGTLDELTRDVLMEIGPRLTRGDDEILRGVVSLFESAGFEVVAAHDLAPDLLPPPGVLTVAQPGEADIFDVERAQAVLAALGPLDVGQACVVAAGQVLAIEALGGTDWMLGTLAGDLPGRPASPGGVLCKAPKPGQDRRIDLPALGPATMQAVHSAGLRGVAIEAGGAIVVDREEAVALADQAGLFIWVKER